MHESQLQESLLVYYGMIMLENVCDDDNYLLCSCSFVFVKVFQLFNHPICANIKRRTKKDILPEWDISWVNTQVHWLLREFAFQLRILD